VGKIAKGLLKTNPSLNPDDITGFLDAHRTLADLLGDVVPTIDSLFHEEPTSPPDIPAAARSGKVETLQQSLALRKSMRTWCNNRLLDPTNLLSR